MTRIPIGWPISTRASAQALVGLGRYDEALAACRAIAGMRPQVARWNESLVLLLLGRYAEGWREIRRPLGRRRP